MNSKSAWLWVLILSLPLSALARFGKHAATGAGSKPQAAAGQTTKSELGKAEHYTSNPADPALYAGTDTCKSCHEEIGKTYDHGPHWKTMLNNKGVQYQGCEA